jgi:gamma-glutamylcyclotransferase (GGCT)/AIG2-like uncharacterized protein YtfP
LISFPKGSIEEMIMTRRLFIYVTLREDTRNSMFRLLARDASLVGRARIGGRLYDLGEYPGLVSSSDADAWVYGEVYSLEDPDEALPRLDDYEECGPGDPEPHEFAREQLDAELETGERTRTWVYVYKGATEGKAEITSGDYFGYAR